MAIYLGNTPIAENVTIQQGGGVTIDDTLSDTSKNPVQNKVINAALNSKANLSDIPTTLPANGGNADISKYIGTWGSPEQYYGSHLKARILFNKFGDSRLGLTTDTDNEIRVDYATNADTLDGKHASEFASYQSYAPIYTGDILDIPEMGTYSCAADGCTNLPSEIASWCYVTAFKFRDAGYKRFICVALNDVSSYPNVIWLASESNKTSDGKLIWSKANDGGNANTLNGRSIAGINSLVRYTCGNYDCNTTISTGVYRGTFTNYPSNLPDGQGTLLVMNYSGENSEISGTVGTDTMWIRQWFISPHGYYVYERVVSNTAVSAWTPINDGGNAATLETHPASDFLYANGFAGQLAKLFSQPASDDELATLFSVVPDDATLDSLNPGIYVVNSSAARRSLKIPNETSKGGPNGTTIDNLQCVGGILIKLGSILGKPGFYVTVSGQAVDRPFTTSCAFFISNNGSIYRAIESINQGLTPKGETYMYPLWVWKAFVFDSFSNSNAYSIQHIKYIDTDVTLAPGEFYEMYHTYGQFVLPYTHGTAYGPTKSFPLKQPSPSNPNLCIVNSSSTENLIIPAGRYLIHAS